ncbi:MAG: alpha-galactosidase, partial [Kiritimatiellae bacterium]|nr:alpha-galactosidase [Kiritimatiellia bacterium]
MENMIPTAVLGVCILSLASSALFGAATGVESDPAGTGAECQAPCASSRPHLRVTAWDLRDRTDDVGELVQKREWLLLPTTRGFELTANVVDVQDVVTGKGTVYLRLAPLPSSRSWEGPDFEVRPDSPQGVAVVERPCRTLEIPYEGGAIGRRAALMAAQRALRPFVPGRDGLFLSNTWGDRNRDARLCEPFMLKEIDAAAKLGVDIVQIDDGWQKGRTANSSAANGKGVWDGYWATDPEFWKPDPVRFPNGLKTLVDAAAAKGMGLGLWFGPDSSNDAANWERDADLLLDFHRTLGISYFKIDSLKTRSSVSLERQSALFEKVLKGAGGRVVFDLDVTAERRPGYFGLPEIGPVFVENRYTDWGKYWPHQTLRQFWALADVVDPVRLRMEVLNPLRNREKYAGDPLAPSNWPIESVFASVMLGSPLGWFEASGLAPETVARLAPFVAVWKRHRDRLHSGVVHPVGEKPDGVAWTGFVVKGEEGLDVVLFRELNARQDCTLDLGPFGPASSAEVLSPRGAA